MSYNPISGFALQTMKTDGQVAADYYLKFYEANSTTPLSMATDASGAVLLAKAKLNDQGMPISNPLDNTTVFIPYLNKNYRLVVYTSEADADANNTAAAFVNIASVELSASAGDITANGGYLEYGGTANTITLTNDSGSPSAYSVGQLFRFRATATNTGAVTINVNGAGAKSAVTIDGSALPASYLATDKDTTVTYDGTNFVVYPPVQSSVSDLSGGKVVLTEGFKSRSFVSYNTIAQAKADTDLSVGDRVKTAGYTAAGDGGGAEYIVVAGGTGTDDGGSYHDMANGLQLELVTDGAVDCKAYGAKAEAAHDNTTALTNLFTNQKNILISEGTFEHSGWLPVFSDTTIKFDGWLKVVGAVAQYEAPLTMSTVLNGGTCSNITIINPQIDCNNQPAANGIIFRDGAENVKVLGGRIKNCAHDRIDGGGYGGGRAVNVEAGTTAQSNPTNISISGLTIENCYQAVSVSGNGDSKEKNILVTDIIAYNCESLIALQGNGPGFPHSGLNAGVTISNITGYNVGRSITFTRAHGIINVNRGCNALITGVKVFNDSTYTSTGYGVGAVVYGEMANITLNDIDVMSDVTDIINLNTWAEVDSLPAGQYGSRRLRFNIQHRGVATDSIQYAYSYNGGLPETEGSANPSDNHFEICTEQLTSGMSTPAAIATYETFWIKLYESSNNSWLTGFAPEVGAQTLSNFSLNQGFGGPVNIVDAKSDRTGGVTIRSFAPSIRMVDLSGSATWWETYVDGNTMNVAYSTDSGSTWPDRYYFGSTYFSPAAQNSQDLGFSAALQWRDLYIQNSPTVSSDVRVKNPLGSIPQELLDFAMSVEIQHYTLKGGQSGRHHYGILITDDFLTALNKVADLDKCAAFCHSVFTDKNGQPVDMDLGGVTLGDVWQVRYDEWQNILLEALRRKLV